MADISYSISVNVTKDKLASYIATSGVTATMGSAGLKVATYTLNTSAASISTDSLASVGMCFMQNLSTATASTVQVGIVAGGSFVSFTTLRAGEPALVRLSQGTGYYAVGSAGSRLRVDITEG